MAPISFKNVRKMYPDGTVAVKDVSLDIADGEFVVLVGPSGCGKTTLLRSLAGIETITSGEIWIGDRAVNDLKPQDRDIAMVFQNYALYANMTVFENLAFPLRNRGLKGEELKERVERAARTLSIEEFLQRKPANLSGGQRQRVAIGRAVVREPQAFLMDEPLSNLDAKLRGAMRAELTLLHRQLTSTVVYVTHDQVEAMTMADRVAVMWQGIIQQVGVPTELYERPKNLFVANFIGSPTMNFMLAELAEEGGRPIARSGETVLDVSGDQGDPRTGQLRERLGREVVIGFRPEHISTDGSSPDAVAIESTVDVVEDLGYEKLAYFRAGTKRPHGAGGGMLDSEQEGGAQSRMAYCARMNPDTPLTEGRAKLYLDRRRLHMFDPGSGLTIGTVAELAAA